MNIVKIDSATVAYSNGSCLRIEGQCGRGNHTPAIIR